MLGPSLVDLLALDSNIPLNAVLFSSIYTDIAQNRDNLHNRTETTLNILSNTSGSVSKNNNISVFANDRHANQENVIDIKISKLIPPKYQPRARVAVWNARSIKNKTTVLSDFIISQNLDIMAVTETWLTGKDRDDSCLLYTSPSPRDLSTSRMPSSA